MPLKKKLTIALSILLLVLPLISSFGADSDDYSITSFHTGLSGQEASNSEYDATSTLTYQQTGGDAEGLDYAVTTGWFSQEGYCGDGVCNSGETCASCVADCACASGYSCVGGVCTADSVTPSGGGGGTSACTYDWVCSEWYPEPCPGDGIQKRVCVNRGTCAGTLGMPDITRTCTPEVISPADPLFDIFARIPLKKKLMLVGDVVELNLKLINVGNTTTLDVFLKYWIVDEKNRLITELQETRAIGERGEFKVELLFPKDLEPGIYKVYAQVTYDVDKVAMANDSFEVMKSKFTLISKTVILLSLSFSVILILIVLLFKLLRKNRKKYKKIFRKKRKSYKTFRKKKRKSHKIFRRKRRKPRKETKEYKEIFPKLKQRKPVFERKIKPQEKKVVVRKVKKRITKRQTLKQIKQQPVSKPSKSLKSQEKLKAHMFRKLLNDTVRLKKSTKKPRKSN